jgi:uncharacterized protein YjiS (DUF1127 family)
MSVHTADSQFSFRLPSLSYIDTRWEEPAVQAASPKTARKGGIAAWLSRRIAAFVAWRRDNEAAKELASMTDHELMDIGMSRADLPRVFDPANNQDLRQRGTYA